MRSRRPRSLAPGRSITTIENGAPTSGQPSYVIGPRIGRAGDNIPLHLGVLRPTLRPDAG